MKRQLVKKTYKQSLKTRRVYHIKGMDCTSCAMVIEMDLMDRGVKANCSYTKEILDVEFDNKKITEEEIKKIVKQSGFDLV